MGKILNINDYGIGYDQGRSDGYAEGYEAGLAENEKRIAALVAEMRTMEARVQVAHRQIDEFRQSQSNG